MIAERELSIGKHKVEAEGIAREEIAQQKRADDEAKQQREAEEARKAAEKESEYMSRAEVKKQQDELDTKRKAAAKKLETSERAEKMLATKQPSAQSLFAQPQEEWGAGKSKIWKALNPQPLAWETGRERAEKAGAKVTVSAEDTTHVDYAFLNEVEQENMAPDEEADPMDGPDMPAESSSEDEEEDEEVDPDTLTLDDEFMAQMMKNRAAREKEEAERKAKLRGEFEAQQAVEQAVIDKELAVIRARQKIEHAEKEAAKEKAFQESQARMAS